MLIFYLMSRKYNNYGSGSSKLVVFWLIGSMFLSAISTASPIGLSKVSILQQNSVR